MNLQTIEVDSLNTTQPLFVAKTSFHGGSTYPAAQHPPLLSQERAFASSFYCVFVQWVVAALTVAVAMAVMVVVASH